MSSATLTEKPETADTSSEAIDKAGQGDGEANGREREGWAPSEYGFLARGVYRSSYAVSYGMVFPIILVARFIPKNNPLIYGVIDGSRAAIDSVERIKATRESRASVPQDNLVPTARPA